MDEESWLVIWTSFNERDASIVSLLCLLNIETTQSVADTRSVI